MALPDLVAHRGYPLHYPENSLIGIEAAIAAGARYFEIDIQLSADQVPILSHDRDLRRICGVPEQISRLPYERLGRLRAGEYERFGYRYAQVRLTTLEQVRNLLRRYPSVTAFVELKRASIDHFGPATVLRRVAETLAPVIRQAVLISYHREILVAARRQGWPTLGVILESWRERRDPAVKALQPAYVFCDVDDLPRWGRLRIPGSRVAVFEVTDPLLAARLARRGVDLVETFAIGEMAEAFALLRAYA